jgi:hypothetical protein
MCRRTVIGGSVKEMVVDVDLRCWVVGSLRWKIALGFFKHNMDAVVMVRTEMLVC